MSAARIDGWLSTEDVNVSGGVEGVVLYVGQEAAVVLSAEDADELAVMLGLAALNCRREQSVRGAKSC